MPTPRGSFAIVTVAGVSAYDQAIAGIREQMVDCEVLDVHEEKRLRDVLNGQGLVLAIAVGSDAVAALDRFAPPALPVVKSVLLEWDLAGRSEQKHSGTAITVDMQPATLVDELVRLFPTRTRLGAIRGPMQTESDVSVLEQAAHERGLTLKVVTCWEARDLVNRFLQFKSDVDFVWCPPNPQLYNSATLKPLLVASITNRLPVIAYSEQLVEAGALFGGAPDFRDVGRMTAEVALRILRHEPVPAKLKARRFHFAYNQRVARLVDVKAAGLEEHGEDLQIIR
ncbi:MAG TPA: ABC transporter substrate binding protein [Terriglobales bacterium]|nr:ABC transporter substrate binding protein [Terriglobales bacterium]